jgi:hypothetical protein
MRSKQSVSLAHRAPQEGRIDFIEKPEGKRPRGCERAAPRFFGIMSKSKGARTALIALAVGEICLTTGCDGAGDLATDIHAHDRAQLARCGDVLDQSRSFDRGNLTGLSQTACPSARGAVSIV